MYKFLILAALFTACNAPQQLQLSDNASAITDINVIDVRNGNVLEKQTIVVDSGKIVLISESYKPANNIKKIDGSGKYLLPGLTEMHAHIPSPQWGRNNLNETLFLYLSNGVTTIRGMLGHPVHLELREQAFNNEILSPRIYISSPSVNGNSVKTVAEARAIITAHKEAGYDFLKIHPGLKLEVFNEIVKVANEIGIPYAGHVPVDVGIRNALNSKYATVDHVDGFLEGLVPEGANVDPTENGFFGFDFTDLAEVGNADELVRLAKENKVWIVPTQSLFERWFSPLNPDSLGSTPEMSYMPKSTVDNWVSNKKAMIAGEAFSVEKWERFDEIRRELIFKLQKEGYGLLLGSDAPQVFNVPGFSIHHEIQGMLNAGVTPLQALQAGTINPAKFFNSEGEYGEITTGASADFILLEGNPLDDMANLKRNAGVMVRGLWLSKADIDKRLEEIANNMKNQ